MLFVPIGSVLGAPASSQANESLHTRARRSIAQVSGRPLVFSARRALAAGAEWLRSLG